MSAFIKATTVLSGLALTGAAGAFALRTPTTEFSQKSLVASEHSASETRIPKKLPSNFLEFSVGKYSINNVRV